MATFHHRRIELCSRMEGIHSGAWFAVWARSGMWSPSWTSSIKQNFQESMASSFICWDGWALCGFGAWTSSSEMAACNLSESFRSNDFSTAFQFRWSHLHGCSSPTRWTLVTNWWTSSHHGRCKHCYWSFWWSSKSTTSASRHGHIRVRLNAWRGVGPGGDDAYLRLALYGPICTRFSWSSFAFGLAWSWRLSWYGCTGISNPQKSAIWYTSCATSAWWPSKGKHRSYHCTSTWRFISGLSAAPGPHWCRVPQCHTDNSTRNCSEGLQNATAHRQKDSTAFTRTRKLLPSKTGRMHLLAQQLHGAERQCSPHDLARWRLSQNCNTACRRRCLPSRHTQSCHCSSSWPSNRRTSRPSSFASHWLDTFTIDISDCSNCAGFRGHRGSCTTTSLDNTDFGCKTSLSQSEREITRNHIQISRKPGAACLPSLLWRSLAAASRWSQRHCDSPWEYSTASLPQTSTCKNSEKRRRDSFHYPDMVSQFSTSHALCRIQRSAVGSGILALAWPHFASMAWRAWCKHAHWPLCCTSRPTRDNFHCQSTMSCSTCPKSTGWSSRHCSHCSEQQSCNRKCLWASCTLRTSCSHVWRDDCILCVGHSLQQKHWGAALLFLAWRHTTWCEWKMANTTWLLVTSCPSQFSTADLRHLECRILRWDRAHAENQWQVQSCAQSWCASVQTGPWLSASTTRVHSGPVRTVEAQSIQQRRRDQVMLHHHLAGRSWPTPATLWCSSSSQTIWSTRILDCYNEARLERHDPWGRANWISFCSATTARWGTWQRWAHHYHSEPTRCTHHKLDHGLPAHARTTRPWSTSCWDHTWTSASWAHCWWHRSHWSLLFSAGNLSLWSLVRGTWAAKRRSLAWS